MKHEINFITRGEKLTQNFTFSNGTIIQPDGTVIKKDGTRIILEEGEGVDWNGDLISRRHKKAKGKKKKSSRRRV